MSETTEPKRKLNPFLRFVLFIILLVMLYILLAYVLSVLYPQNLGTMRNVINTL